MQDKGLLRPKIYASQEQPSPSTRWPSAHCTSQWPNMEIEKEKRPSVNPTPENCAYFRH